uniref:glycosyltransferase family 39 protein n=1 Tax=uncultured Campylobacter sp. TaxID=218934 RepID=UPI002620855D
MFNTKILENLMVAFCFCITLALHLLIFNHYFSLQEGWWETYAYLVNRGEVINKDFYLAWTPLFVYINAFYQKIFGINFFAFACIGVVAAMIQVILLYAVLREFFSRVSSILGATFASFLWFGMETYIAKDYHTYVFIIEFSTLLFLVKSIKNKNSKKGIIYQILGILFLVLLFFIKQNVGLVLFASLFVSYAFISSSVKDYLKRIGFLLLFTIIFFASINFIMPFDSSSITDNDSKGSLWTIATRFWTNNVNF